jgi:hypothetical protein
MLGEMPTGKRSPRRAGFLGRIVGSIIAAVFAFALLCRCGSPFSAATSSSALDAAVNDGTVVNIASPYTDGPGGSDDAGDGGAQSDAGNTVGPADSGNGSCNPAKDPKDAPCLVDGVFGVFVSGTTGHDSAIGSKADPLKTIGEGIAKAAQVGKSRVYVCNGTYAEQVSLDVQHDGIGLYGGFDCASGWAWNGDAGQAQVVGPAALYALRVNATTKAIAIEDMTFTVPDATGYDSTGAGNSSIAAFLSNEPAGVNFQRVTLRAGAGVAGSDGGAPATNWFSPNVAALQGNGADGGAGGAARDCRCKTVGDTSGGAGGAQGDPAGDGGTGTASPLPLLQPPRNGAGGAGYVDMTGVCMPGRAGADGTSQGDAGVGAAVGTLSASGWEPGSATSGLFAYPGQGGGGGGGGQTAGGAGGGCGGCGGAGGTAGHGGGASVALLLYNAVVALGDSRLITSAGGAGGSGGAGENGAGGGAGGYVGACGGGAGGSGAGGQGGGGGAGGASIGILSNAVSHAAFDGQTTFMLGTPGTGGPPGSGGAGGSVATDHAPSGPPGTKGADGVAQQTLSR